MAVIKISAAGAAAKKRRLAFKDEFWAEDVPWLGHEEVGFFCAPRTLPFVLRALRQKAVSGDKDPGTVYVDLLAGHMGQGVVELGPEDDHAYSAGYANVRSWRDRMKVLEDAGFIKTTTAGNRKYAKVLLIHPGMAMGLLHKKGLIPESLWQAYRSRQIAAKETSPDELAALSKNG